MWVVSRYCKDPSPLLVDIVRFGLSITVNSFKTNLLGRGFHTLVRNILFLSLTCFKTVRLTVIHNGPKQTISTSGGLGSL